MNLPAAPKKLGEHTGRITRWGAGGFGFIECAALKKDAYFKASFVSQGEPALGLDVAFVAVEYPGDKIVAREVRVLGAAANQGAPARRVVGAPLAGRIRGLEALATVVKPVARAPETAHRTADATPEVPASLPAVVRAAQVQTKQQVAELQERAARLETEGQEAAAEVQSVREVAERQRRDLERRLAELEVETTRRIEGLRRSAEERKTQAEALRAESGTLEQNAGASVVHAAIHYLTTERNRFSQELVRRDRAAKDLAGARQQAARTAGEERVTKYEHARRRARAAQDAEDREAFVLLERDRRDAVRVYAEALDAQEATSSLEAPFWMVGGDDAAVVHVVAPYEPSSPESDGSIWRVHSALLQAAERLRHELGTGGASRASIEAASIAGCFALRLVGLDADLLPLSMEDAVDARPSLARLGVKLRFEEQRDLRLPVEPAHVSVESLDSVPSVRPSPPAGGSTREVARRLGMSLDQLVATLVASGLPFEDDTLTVDTERSLHALLDVEPPSDPRPSAPVIAVEEVPLDPALDAARRILGKLLRAHVIGGKHTRIDNVYGHHFADSEKDVARDVMERLIRLGVLNEKSNVGARHVSIEPRKLALAQSLAGGQCADAEVVAALRGAR